MSASKTIKIKQHTLSKLLSLNPDSTREKKLKQIREELFTKSLDIIQLHRSSKLRTVTDADWEECEKWYIRMCNKDWTALNEIPSIIIKFLPEESRKRLGLEG